MSNVIKKLFSLILLIFIPPFMFAAPQITINSPSGEVSTESSVEVNASVVDPLSTYGFVDWDDSLIGWWRAEDNTNDDSRHANHGTLVGDAHIVDNGKFGKAFSFDGEGDSVSIGDQDVFDLHKTDSFTISAWVNKFDNFETGILTKGRGFTLFYHESKRWQFTLDGHYTYAGEPNPEGKWVHVAVVYDALNKTLLMYIDGERKAGGSVSDIEDFSSASNLGIGKGRYSGIEHNGLIDEVIIFKRALGSDEIRALYEITGNSFINTYTDLTEFTTYTYQLHAVNSNGERAQTNTRSIFIDVPNTPPRVVLEYPLDNTRVDSPQQTFRCRVFNTNRDTQLKNVSFYWDYPGSFMADETKEVSGDTAAVEFTKTNLAEKTFQWNCYAADTNNNGGFAPDNFTYTVGRDAYYVSTDGDDTNAGTIEKPFRTIQKAADITRPGDTVYIRAGTYRETVTPQSSGNACAPITFKAYPGEKAAISGADVVDPQWILDKGFIYKTKMNWDMGKGKNQIFVDGEALIEARWPNTEDISRPKYFPIHDGSYDGQTAVIYSTYVVQSAGFWDGATVHAIWNPRYHAITGDITQSSNGRLDVSLNSRPYGQINQYGIFYITGSYNALDKAGEWFYDSADSTLYLWMPGNDPPLSYHVEAKRRDLAFNLNGKSYITIEGLHIFAANIITDDDSHHILIDNCVMKYITHYTLIDEGSMGPGPKGVNDTGVILDGHDNTLKNSYIAYSAGNGVALIGDNNTVHNCTIHDINYVVTDCAAVHTGTGKTENNKITHNRLYNAGRTLIEHSDAHNLKILHNEMYHSRWGWETWDLGATYAIATDGKGTEIAYNYIHDARSIGIYLDNYNYNFLVHHNVIETYKGMFIGLFFNTPTKDNQAYHNTVLSGIRVRADTPASNVIIKNNIMERFRHYHGTNPPPPEEVELSNNIALNTTDPTTVFVDFDNKDFRLKAGSPAIDAGLDLGFTHDVSGNPIVNAPDIGAYEYNPGSQASNYPVAIFSFYQKKSTSLSYEVTFTATQSYDTDGMIVNYAWDFGDGTTTEGKEHVYIIHEYQEKGFYQVTLTVTDNAGNKTSQTQTVNVGYLGTDDGDDDISTNEFELYAVNVHGTMRKNEILHIQGKVDAGSLIYAVRILDVKGNVLNINFDHAVTIDADGNISGSIPIIEIIKKYPMLTSINIEVVVENGGIQLRAETGLIMLSSFETKIACYNNIIMPSKGVTEAIIHVELAENAHVSVVIYDTQGREVKVAMDEDKEPGTYVLPWDATKEGGSKVGSGIYLIHMKAGGYKKTKKIAVIK